MATDPTNNVSTPRTDYKNTVTAWTLVEDACGGESSVKHATVKYLSKPNPRDISEENRTRYEQYLMRAVYYNAIGRTLSGLIGLAFRRDPDIEVPVTLESVLDDADGAGLTLVHKGQQLLSQVLKAGRAGILVDYPKTEGPTSIANLEAGGIRPIICLYEALDTINWRTIRSAGKTLLSMLVLRESYEEDAVWVAAHKTQYRVLRLTFGIYTTEVWREDPDHPGDWLLAEGPITPLQGDGSPWDMIPFTFVGAEDNDTDIDGSPLYDLAVLNLSHYRNSADYEDSVYFVGQPMYWVSGMSEARQDETKASGFYVGSRQILTLPQGGQAGILQAEPNSLARQAMMDKESQMAALGARLLLTTGQVKTATQQQSEDAASHSVLTLCCNNVSLAMTLALGWYAKFANVTGDTNFKISTEFVIDTLDAPTLVALLQLVQAGKLPESDLWAQLRNVGLIDSEKTDDEIREEIASQIPTGLTPLGASGLPGGSGAGKPGGGVDSAGRIVPNSSSSRSNGGLPALNPEGISDNVPRGAVGG